jgi:hypothetical protein
MPSMRRRSTRFRFALTALAAFGVSTFAATYAKADTWTVLAYVAGDNNLERFAIEDIKEMSKVGTGQNLKIAVQLDRSLKYSQESLPGVANFKGTKRLRVDKDNVVELQNVGNPDGTQPSTIGDFIKWGIATFPADHYAVVLWDHGSGWKGCCEDESGPGRDYTPLNDISEGLRLGLEGSGRQKYDLIGFDECLMAGVEVAHAIQPYGKIMVSSAETEPGRGWDYEPFMKAIVSNPSIDAPGLGKAIADGYTASAGDSEHTLSVVDLEKVPALVTAMDSLSDTLGPAAAVRETWTPMARARANSEKYANSGFSDPLAAIDLGNFIDGLGSANAGFKPSADAARAAMNAAVLYKVQGSGHAKHSGLSIHLPEKAANAEYLGVAYGKTRWPGFIANYAIGSGSDPSPPDIDDPDVEPFPPPGPIPNLPNIIGPVDFLSQSQASDLNLANLIVSSDSGNGGSTFLGMLPATVSPDGKMRAKFDGRWPTLTDGVQDGFAPFFTVSQFTEKGGGTRQMLAMVADLGDTAGGYRPGIVMFKYDPATRDATVSRAYTYDLFKGFGSVEVGKDVPKVRPWVLTVQSFGLPTAAPGTKEFNGTTLALKTKALPKSTYQVGFVASDLAGNLATKQTRVHVDVPQDSPNPDDPNADPNADPNGDASRNGARSTTACDASGAHGTSNAVFLVGTLGALALFNVRRRRAKK